MPMASSTRPRSASRSTNRTAACVFLCVLMEVVTEDHTYEHLVADAAAVPNLPERLSRWLDGRPDGRSPDLTTRDLRPGDRFLLCSDGLSSFVPLDLVHAALSSSSAPDEVAD